MEKEDNIPQITIRNWNKKYISHPKLYSGLGNKHGRINQSNLIKEDCRERYEILKKYQASSLQEYIQLVEEWYFL